jgi:hypothetical protein
MKLAVVTTQKTDSPTTLENGGLTFDVLGEMHIRSVTDNEPGLSALEANTSLDNEVTECILTRDMPSRGYHLRSHSKTPQLKTTKTEPAMLVLLTVLGHLAAVASTLARGLGVAPDVAHRPLATDTTLSTPRAITKLLTATNAGSVLTDCGIHSVFLSLCVQRVPRGNRTLQ